MKLNVKAALKSLAIMVLSFFIVVGVLNAATTIGTNISTGGTLAVTDVSTLTGNTILSTASSTGLIKAKSLSVGAPSTEASTISGLVFGFCNIPAKTIVGTTTVYAVCDTATGVIAGDRVFVQATSSLNGGGATLAGGAFIAAASSTAANTISILLGSTGDADGTTVTIPVSVNFWAVR